MKKYLLRISVITACALILSSCAGLSYSYKKSPFLGNFGNYSRASHNPDVRLYKKRKADLSAYRKLSVQPVKFFYKRGEKGQRMDDTQAEQISSYLTGSLNEKLASGYSLSNTPVNGGLTVKIALVNLHPADSKTMLQTSNTVLPVNFKDARLEMELLDGRRRQAAMVYPLSNTVPSVSGGYTYGTVLADQIDVWTSEIKAVIDDFTRSNSGTRI